MSLSMITSIVMAASMGILAPPVEVQAALAAAVWDEDELARLPSATFVSAESQPAKGDAVTNRIQFDQVNGFDIWRMRQQSSGESGSSPHAYTNWSYIGIVVEHADDQTTANRSNIAYYFEWEPKPVQKGQLPRQIALRVDCTRCHASGPRLIRPKGSDSALIRAWNTRIEAYGVVNLVQGHVKKTPYWTND